MKKVVLIVLMISLFFTPRVWAEESVPKTNTVDVDLADTEPSPSQDPLFPPSDVVDSEPSEDVPSEDVADTDALTVPTAPSALAEARQLVAAGDYQEAKNTLTPAIAGLEGEELDQAQDVLAEINHKILFEGKGEFPGVSEYKVKRGDSLYVIAKKNKTTPELISLLNGVKGATIFPEQTLRIISSPFSIHVSKSKNRLELYLGDDIIRTYRVATGTNGSTPEGTFTITTKLENPTWYKTGAVVAPGDKENILGTRWLGFSAVGYGIHGTTIPESIGTQSTSGCVRMRNEEVEELYALVPSGAKVTIVN